MDKRYLLVMACHNKEDMDGTRWIDEDEFNRIKSRSKRGKMRIDCRECNLKVEDSDGSVVFSHCSSALA